MIKTGKIFIAIGVFLLIAAFNHQLIAQDVTVEATLTETNIFEGESIQLDIAVTGSSLSSLERPQIPDIPGLRFLPNQTFTGSNYSYKNGKPSLTQTFGFRFIAQKPGNYSVPPVKISVNNKEYTTKAISFKVLDPKTIDKGNAERVPDIYVRLEPTISNPVVGQQVIIDVVLYFKNDIEVSNYQTVPGWKAEGFWKEELNNPAQARSTSTIINGTRFKRARLLQYALFPTKAGKLTLSPYNLSVRIRNGRNNRSVFSFGFNQENKELQSLPVTINVNRLPEAQNAEYFGAVGNFTIKRSIKPESAYVGESVEIITEISGSGNVPLLNKPEYEFPESLELYNPQENTTITRNNRQIAGNRVFTDIVIARNSGTYTIPEKRVAIYNPAKNTFDYSTLPSIVFKADLDPNAVVTSLEDMRLDIDPVIGLANWKTIQKESLSSKKSIWVMILVPFLLFIGAYGYKNYYDKLNNDSGFARSNKAKQKAHSTLDEAQRALDIKEGYHLVQKAVSQFITDKLNLPEAGVSSGKLVKEVDQKSPGSSLTSELKLILDKCETIAFAPNVTQKGLENDISRAKELIKELGKIL